MMPWTAAARNCTCCGAAGVREARRASGSAWFSVRSCPTCDEHPAATQAPLNGLVARCEHEPPSAHGAHGDITAAIERASGAEGADGATG